MHFDLVTIPCLSDNYAFLLRDQDSGSVALIDAPEAGPIAARLHALGWTLNEIWLTHHHPDHVQGVPELLAKYPARVIDMRFRSLTPPDTLSVMLRFMSAQPNASLPLTA